MIIDLHGHCTPLEYLKLLERRTKFPFAVREGDGFRVDSSEQQTYRAAPLHWDLAARIEALDAAGISRQVLSLSAPYGFERLEGEDAVDAADTVNAALRAAATPFADRFPTLAIAPVTDVTTGVDSLRRALASGHCGMILSASVVAGLPSDEVVLPYLQAVDAAGGFVLVHPGARVEMRGLPDFGLAIPVAGFQNELAVALFRLLFGGLLDCVPSLPVVFVNLGGAAPLLAERMRGMWEARGSEGEPPDLRFRRAHYDFSSFGPHSLETAAAVLGADRIVFGSDFPIQGLDRPQQSLNSANLAEAAREAIRHGNAEQILSQR